MKFNFRGYPFILGVIFSVLTLIQLKLGVIIVVGKGNDSRIITLVDNPSDFWFFIHGFTGLVIIFFALFILEAFLEKKR